MWHFFQLSSQQTRTCGRSYVLVSLFRRFHHVHSFITSGCERRALSCDVHTQFFPHKFPPQRLEHSVHILCTLAHSTTQHCVELRHSVVSSWLHLTTPGSYDEGSPWRRESGSVTQHIWHFCREPVLDLVQGLDPGQSTSFSSFRESGMNSGSKPVSNH